MSGAGQAKESIGYSYEPGEQPGRGCAIDGRVSQAVLNDLVQMHRTRAGAQGSSFEPISVEMVEAALCRVLAQPGTRPVWLRPLAEQVARTLRDDATAGPRMQAFWDQVQQQAGCTVQ